jgi:hypothetical protein
MSAQQDEAAVGQSALTDGLGVCEWKDDDDGSWWTACGEGWNFIDGGPMGNGMKYCPFCGKPLAEVANQTADQTGTE